MSDGILDEMDRDLSDDTQGALEAAAARFGLRKTSGQRSPSRNAAVGGAVRSYHLSGQADDFAGSPEAMKAFHAYVKAGYGDKLNEVIHGSGDHTDHVHVAWKAPQQGSVLDEMDRELGAPKAAAPATRGKAPSILDEMDAELNPAKSDASQVSAGTRITPIPPSPSLFQPATNALFQTGPSPIEKVMQSASVSPEQAKDFLASSHAAKVADQIAPPPQIDPTAMAQITRAVQAGGPPAQSLTIAGVSATDSPDDLKRKVLETIYGKGQVPVEAEFAFKVPHDYVKQHVSSDGVLEVQIPAEDWAHYQSLKPSVAQEPGPPIDVTPGLADMFRMAIGTTGLPGGDLVGSGIAGATQGAGSLMRSAGQMVDDPASLLDLLSMDPISKLLPSPESIAAKLGATPEARKAGHVPSFSEAARGHAPSATEKATAPTNALYRAGDVVEKLATKGTEGEGLLQLGARMAGGVAPIVASSIAGPMGPVTVMSMQARDEMLQDAIAHGATKAQANEAMAAISPIAAALGFVPGGAAARNAEIISLLKPLMREIAVGGGTMAMQQVAKNKVAQGFDPERKFTKGVGEAALSGALMGPMMAAHGLTKGGGYAEEIRSDSRQTGVEGRTGEAGQDQRGQNIQRDTKAGSNASDRQEGQINADQTVDAEAVRKPAGTKTTAATKTPEAGQVERRVTAGQPPEGTPERRGAIVSETPATGPEGIAGAVSQMRQEKRGAERAAETDAMTQTGNRAALDKALPAAEADPNTSVAVFDINDAGKVNKLVEHGQTAGDTVIVKAADAIKQAAREAGVPERVFRRGGDEFVALLPKDKAETIKARAEELMGEQTFEGTHGQTGEKMTVKTSLTGSVADTFKAADEPLQGLKSARKQLPQEPAKPVEPAPTGNLTRNFRAGTNDASMTFQSGLQRDLYDLAAGERKSMKNGGERGAGFTPANAEKLATQRTDLAKRLGIPESEAGNLARQVHDDVRGQMKGIKHLEERALTDGVGLKATAEMPPTEPTARVAKFDGKTGEPLSPKPPVEPPTEPPNQPTSPKNAVTEAERAARNLPPVEKQAYQAIGESFLTGKAEVDAGSMDPRTVAASVAKTPRPLSATEVGALGYDRAKLINEHKQALDAIGKAVDKGDDVGIQSARDRLARVESDLDINDQALQRGGREQSAAFNARKMLIKDDYSLARAIQRVKAATGRDIAPEARGKLEDLTKQLETMEGKLADTEGRASAAEDKIKDMEAAAAVREMDRATKRTRRAVTKTDLDAEFADLMKQMRSGTGVRGGGEQGAVTIDAELAKLIGKMAVNRVKAGFNTVGGLVDHLYDNLRDHVDGLTKRDVRDAISGYGKTAHPNADPLAAQLRDLNQQARALSALEDIEAGQRPEASGFQPEAPSAEVAALREQVKEAMRRAGFTASRNPDSARKAYQKRLTNQIGDLQAQIDAGQLKSPSPRIKPIYDADTVKLQRQRDVLRHKIDQTIANQQRTSLLAMASAFRKAGLLSGVKTHLRNVGGNVNYAGFTEVSRVPGSLADMVAGAVHAAVTGKGYRRTYTGFSPSAIIDSLHKAATTGGREAWDIIKHGATPEEMHKLQLHKELNSGVKVIDKAVNTIFRLMSAEDRIFYNGHLRRNLLDRARAQALTERRATKGLDVAARTAELANAPTDQLRADAEHDALVATFNNNNKLSSIIQDARSKIGDTGNFAIDLVMPFDRTPTNIIARMLEASPAGFGKNAYQVGKAIATRAFTAEDQRAFSQTFGRASLGTGLVALGYKLYKAGLATGPPDDEASRRERDKTVGRSSMAVRLPNGDWHQIGSFSPLGDLVAIGAGLAREQAQGSADTGKRIAKQVGIAGKAITEQPLLKGAKEIVDAATQPGTAPEKGARIAASFIPTVLSDIAGVADSKRREASGVAAAFKTRIPGLRNTLPEAIDALGRPMEQRRSASIDPTLTSTARERTDPVDKELVRLDIGLSKIAKRPGEDETLYRVRARKSSEKVYNALNLTVRSAGYQRLSDEQKKDRLGDLIKEIHRTSQPEPQRDAAGRLLQKGQ